MGHRMSDYDPRIIALYDEDNPDGPDHEYYRSLVATRDAKRVLDLGCGTGNLTVTLANTGRTVVGVDPSSAMIACARQRQRASEVTWVEGYSRDVPDVGFDVILMSGNVAQHIPDPEWQATLRDFRRVCADGCVLAFESRNPATRAWESWRTGAPTQRATEFGPLTEWCEADELQEGQVQLRSFTRFEAIQETIVEPLLLTFRSAELVTSQLANAGFQVCAVWGGWDRTPFDGSQPVMIFEARAV
jgi:ubiquinone/menaquinone biosynthesis C-methylase UbiE